MESGPLPRMPGLPIANARRGLEGFQRVTSGRGWVRWAPWDPYPSVPSPVAEA